MPLIILRGNITPVPAKKSKNSSKIGENKNTKKIKKIKNKKLYSKRATSKVSGGLHVKKTTSKNSVIKVTKPSIFSLVTLQKKRGRGRPKKYNFGYALLHWSFIAHKITHTWQRLSSPNQETRGRKKLSWRIRLLRWREQRDRLRLIEQQKRSQRQQEIKQLILHKLGLSRRRGRPKKHDSSLAALITRQMRTLLRMVGFFREYKQVFASLFFSVSIVALAFSGFVYFFADLPPASDLTAKEQAITTKILDRNGQLLYRIYEDENRTLIPLGRVSPFLIQATIAIEDKDFYRHIGFSPTGIMRAVIKNFKGEAIEQGGSTITQQLVKNRLLSPERTFKRKIRELALSLIVEGVYAKNEILEMYLNQVPYGGSTYGAEEASWRYFNKSARDLTLAESALLAGLPAAPSAYSPFGSYPELSYARRDEVLRRMVEDQYVTASQAAEARQQKLTFNSSRTDINAPHFVMYVRQLLAEQFGEEMLTKGGLEVRTTLDLDLQQSAQKILTDEIAKLKPMRISNGAAVITNPKTGEILAMIGSTDYFDFAHDGQVNVVLRDRQPGSSIKPLTYATAMEMTGKTPASIISDAPITYSFPGGKPYSPKNYDGKFHGNVTLRESLGSSYNIPAVKTLAEIGIDNFIDKASLMGISTWADRTRFGLSLTLGGGEVKMIDLAQAYSTFANQGYAVKPTAILDVKTQKGVLLYSNGCAVAGERCSDKQVLSPAISFLISNILSDNQARSPAFGLHSVLHIPNQEVAVKTGTTNSLRDNWTIGYTTDRLVAVWVGNNDNTPMSYVASGITGASPIWSKMMRSLLDDKQPHAFVPPVSVVQVAVCGKTGTLPCTGCPQVRTEYFAEGTQPRRSCSPMVFSATPTPSQPHRP